MKLDCVEEMRIPMKRKMRLSSYLSIAGFFYFLSCVIIDIRLHDFKFSGFGYDFLGMCMAMIVFYLSLRKNNSDLVGK